MTQTDQIVSKIERKMLGDSSNKTQEQKKQEIFEYDSEFMHAEEQMKREQTTKNKDVVMAKGQVEQSLREIYHFYSKAYLQPIQHYDQFELVKDKKLNFQSFLLFCKQFNLLKAIFPLERIKIIFKKHADYGKFLTFDNFSFLVNSMSHQAEAKKFFNLGTMISKLDVQTIEEVEKQQLYTYLQLDKPEKYRSHFKEMFQAFGCQDKVEGERRKYNYRKFSLPQLRKKALPSPKSKKLQKNLIVLKSKDHSQQQEKQEKQEEKHASTSQFAEAKSIVVSWQSLRAKSVSNLRAPEKVVGRYIKGDPQDDEYLREYASKDDIKPKKEKAEKTKEKPKDQFQMKKEPQIDKSNQKDKRSKALQTKIKQIQQRQNVKNQQILKRIEKKTEIKNKNKTIVH